MNQTNRTITLTEEQVRIILNATSIADDLLTQLKEQDEQTHNVTSYQTESNVNMAYKLRDALRDARHDIHEAFKNSKNA